MSSITVTSRRSTAYGPSGEPYEVELTPRVRDLISSGVLHPAGPVPPEAKARKKAPSGPALAVVKPETSTPPPLDHEGEEPDE